MDASNSTGKAGSEALLRIKGLSKTFPGVRALKGVDLTVNAGEVVALLGHNGSGKSTLVKVLAGVYKADEGSQIETDSEIHFIHQDLGLIGGLTTVENLDIDGRTTWRNLLPTSRAEAARARRSIARFGGTFDVTVPVSQITPAERTIVAIARATSSWTSSRNVLVLDEPTATLHGPEADRLREVVKNLAAEGAGILYISHHLAEVVELADRAVVLRDGQAVLEERRGEFDEDTLLRAISGDKVIASRSATQVPRATGPVRLSIRGLRGQRIENLDLDVGGGEIVGLSGLIGSGREEILGCIFGARPAQADAITVDGAPLRLGSTPAAIRAGVGYVPADRRGLAAVSTFTARENLTLSSLPRTSLRKPFLGVAAERRQAAQELAAVDVRPQAPERLFALFSGGNQQKIVIAKWLRTNPGVMLLDEPTQGVDVGARAGIHDLIREMASRGAAFVVASADEEELASLCHRVVVIRDGHIAGELAGDDLTDDNLLRASLTSAQV